MYCTQGSVKIEDGGSIDNNKIGVQLAKEASTESELNSIYLTRLLHQVDRSLVLTLTVVRHALCGPHRTHSLHRCGHNNSSYRARQ